MELTQDRITVGIVAMKTTIDLPADILQNAMFVAAQRNMTLKQLVMTGLNLAMPMAPEVNNCRGALQRLRKGLPLSGGPLTREQAHERG